MPQIPKPGTYPRLHPIMEACKGPNDPAAKNWDKTFGPRVCGACKHWPGAGLTCKARDVPRVMESSSQDACFSAFERAPALAVLTGKKPVWRCAECGATFAPNDEALNAHLKTHEG